MAAFSKVAFIGIGNMGWPMAARLSAAGFEVDVFDVMPGRAAQFAAEIGGRAAASVDAAVSAADAIITILPTSRHVVDVLTPVRAKLAKGALVIDMTSGIPGVTKTLAATLAEDGVQMIDAPVSGGVARAKTGELAIMTGGEPAVVERAMPLLRAMGTTITEVGGIGAGQAMKALNNLVSAGGFLIGVEALLIGKRFGLDAEKMVDVLNASTGMNNSTQKKFKQFVLSRAFNSNFGLDLMAKDLGIALEVAHDGAVSAPFSAMCLELWSAAANSLGKGHDHTELARFSESIAGLSLE
ncbi:NAD(P)-dependent oxidoreductase [Paraburkholderia sp. SARCC-3016]|uniref:NAD(P)-dependent oxidoreductase n=1 Tax=Paraburkholderia sp. SARCC-3016 TaxID=3058611 RepID=UPI002808A869|nr:NAD(P)-dependent oxidoreductase [Paraburkholderia sp. SARCC-3016]MDQ7980646.1 NAD(P)-dependent oxidoreductase [Paraburkholderia sp. SARCC-3016]